MKKAALFLFAAVLTALAGCSMADMVASPYTYENADAYSAGDALIAQEITRIDVDWVSGDVIMEEYEGGEIVLSETADKPIEDSLAMRWSVDGCALRIRFAENGAHLPGNTKKQLTVMIPEGLNLDILQITSVSANVDIASAYAANAVISTVSGDISVGPAWLNNAFFNTESGNVRLGEMYAYEAYFSTVSGNALLQRSDIPYVLAFTSVSGNLEGELGGDLAELRISTVSGDIDLEADDIDQFDIDATSGKIALTLGTAPKKGFADMVSASLSMAIPEDASFKVFFESASGDFESEIPVSGADGLYTAGDGANSYQFTSASGDMKIKISK